MDPNGHIYATDGEVPVPDLTRLMDAQAKADTERLKEIVQKREAALSELEARLDAARARGRAARADLSERSPAKTPSRESGE